jgi:hypothetical protein
MTDKSTVAVGKDHVDLTLAISEQLYLAIVVAEDSFVPCNAVGEAKRFENFANLIDFRGKEVVEEVGGI